MQLVPRKKKKHEESVLKLATKTVCFVYFTVEMISSTFWGSLVGRIYTFITIQPANK